MFLPRLPLLALLSVLSLTPKLMAQQSGTPSPQADPASQPAMAQQNGPNGQQPSAATATNTITQNVRLVALDAVVLDSKGNAVSGLQASDFHITEDGEPQTIRNFDAPGKYEVPQGASIESTADLDRVAPRAPVNIILLDEFNTRFEDMAFARYSLEKQPDVLPSPTMLIAVDLQHFTVLRDYTQNKDEILQALDHHFVAYPWQVHQGAWVAERYSTALLSLRRVAEAVIGHQGHKTMIWVGRGFPTLNWAHVPADQNRMVNSAIQVTINQLRDARVTLYTVDPAGVMIDPGVYGNAARDFASFGGDPDFQALARATGGRNLYGRNDVDAEIGTSIRDGSSFYSFSYRPTNVSTDVQKFRKIKVTVDHPGLTGLTVVTRQGYYPDRLPVRPTADGKAGRNLSAELEGASQSNMVYDAVRFSVDALPEDHSNVILTVDGRGLSWYFATDTSPRHTRLIIMLTYFDKKGKELKQDGKRIDFPAKPGAPATGHFDQTLKFKFPVAPDAKTTRARFVVRVESTGRMGTLDVDVNNGVLSSATMDPVAAQPAAVSATP